MNMLENTDNMRYNVLENVIEILDVRNYMTPVETIVRGIDAEINFFGQFRARAYPKRKTALKILSRHELKNIDIKEAFISLEELSKIAKALNLG